MSEDDIATGHNPTRLTNTQVGTAEGWRLLEEDEARGIMPCMSEIEGFEYGHWNPGYHGCSPELTYRTKLTRAELRKARGLEPEHSPRPDAEEVRYPSAARVTAEAVFTYLSDCSAVERWPTWDSLGKIFSSHFAPVLDADRAIKERDSLRQQLEVSVITREVRAEWDQKLAAKDAEIERLKALAVAVSDFLNSEGSDVSSEADEFYRREPSSLAFLASDVGALSEALALTRRELTEL